MTRGILIAGNETALIRAVENEAIARVDQFASALIPNRLTGAPKSAEPEIKNRISLSWNPASPISARTLVLAAENRLQKIDEAILVCSPPSIRSSTEEIPLADIEIMVNDYIKGWFFLVRELATIFTVRRQGSLVLVYPDISSPGRDDAADVLGPSALASFRALTRGLLSAAHNEPYITAGFSTSDTGNEAAFAAFIFKSIDELSQKSKGKLHKFGKFSLFR